MKPATAFLVGKEYEALLNYLLYKRYYFCVRTIESGRGGGKRVYPDLVCIKKFDDGSINCILIEVKFRSDDRYIYLNRKKYRDYKHLKEWTGCQFLVCVLYETLSEYRCLDIDDYDYITNSYVVYKRTSFFDSKRLVLRVPIR